MKRSQGGRGYALAAITALVAALFAAQAFLQDAADAQAQATVEGPRFDVDPLWPKPLPKHWLLGMTIGVTVDSRDHVWIVHRADTFNKRTEIGGGEMTAPGECCLAAPPVLEFDQAGTLVGHWGGPGSGCATGETF